MDAEKYINVVRPIVLKSSSKMLRNNWAYQQDRARPYTHLSSEKWCSDHFPDLCQFD